jgi:hypothetical protein
MRKWHITDSQKSILDSIICERLSADPRGNVAVLSAFAKNPHGRNGPLSHLQNQGLEDDQSCSSAVYIIKTQRDEGLLAFSLKCGEMYVRDSREFNATQALKKAFFDDGEVSRLPREEQISRFLEICRKKSIDEAQADLAIKMYKDLCNSEKGLVRHVPNTVPGILLVDFCKNFGVSETWRALGLGVERPMGEILFWRFVVPIALSVKKIIGCEYMFLYAADLTQDETLINYYSEALNFKRETKYGVNKPVYDLLCPLMTQAISDMESRRNRYFQEFNMSPDDDK